MGDRGRIWKGRGGWEIGAGTGGWMDNCEESMVFRLECLDGVRCRAETVRAGGPVVLDDGVGGGGYIIILERGWYEMVLDCDRGRSDGR